MKIKNIIVFISFLIFISSCDNNTKDETEDAILDKNIKKQINVQNFFNTIPSASEVIQIVQKAQYNYNPNLLNNPTLYKNYSLEKNKAFNLGVYGADLTVSGLFNQTQEILLILKSTNYLAKELGISDAFNETLADRLEINKNNRDSILQIVSETFKKADKTFTENKRSELSVLMITGAFIESMYVAGEYAFKQTKDTSVLNEIKTLYTKQDEPLSYIINLLNDYKEPDEQKLLEKLNEIHSNLNMCKTQDNFIKTHQLITELRTLIVNTY